MKSLIVATKNPGKVAEIKNRIERLGYEVSSLLDPTIDVEIIEDAGSFEGNAVKKAVATAAASGIPALADDSGLEVDALDGRPGIYSARYGGPGLDDRGRYEYLLNELKDVPDEKRTARFRAVLAYLAPGEAPQTFAGVLEGKISLVPAGSEGFGYDPVFIPIGYNQTLAELGPDIKNRISHRALALDALVEWLS